MDISLRNAFIISVIIHTGIIAPFYSHAIFRHDFLKKNSVIVDYVVLKGITEAPVDVPARVEVKQEIARPKVEVANTVPEIRRDAVKENPVKATLSEAIKKETRIKSSKTYINYYEVIKNRIRIRLKENYRYYKGEGDVYLTFVLDINGRLLSYSIDRPRSVKDEVLIHMAGASLKAVTPFPPLPKAIAAPDLSFSITISFRK